MESSWRMNIFERGLGDWYFSGGGGLPRVARLCARISGGIWVGNWLTDSNNPAGSTAVLAIQGVEVIVPFFVTKPAGAGSHFPYGFPVDPDLH